MAWIPNIGLLNRLMDLLPVARYVIQDHSMTPVLMAGQRILVNRRAYRRSDPARGDVVVFRNPDEDGRHYVKRIVGLPGEQVEVIGASVFTDKVDSSFPRPPSVESWGEERYYLGENQYFVKGEHLASHDSRTLGPVDRSMIVGKCWIRYWPLSQWKSLS